MIVKIAGLNELNDYSFVVIFCKYQNKWLYCRLKGEDTYGNAGGRIETGETTLDAAKRELYEETGALWFDIKPLFDYSVERSEGYTTGQAFLAHIHELGELPDYEMAEVRLFDTFPDKLRFPDILPVLYKNVQVWLNLHSAEDEI